MNSKLIMVKEIRQEMLERQDDGFLEEGLKVIQMSPTSLEVIGEGRRDGGDKACGDDGPEPFDIVEMVVEVKQDHRFACDAVNLDDLLGFGGGILE